MEVSMEEFFYKNIGFPNDIRRRLKTIGALDEKLQDISTEFKQLKTHIDKLRPGSVTPEEEEMLEHRLEELYQKMK
jgi:cell division protein FtsB